MCIAQGQRSLWAWLVAGQTTFREALETIACVLAAVVDEPGWQLPEDQVSDLALTALKVREGLDELTARLVAEAGRRKIPKHAGFATVSAWLKAEGRLSARLGPPVRSARITR